MLGFFLKHPDLLLIATGGLMVVSIPLFPKSFPYSVLPYILPFVAIMPIALVARYKLVSASIVLLIAVAAGYYGKPAGEEFMPPLDEGSILDMPVTVPRAGVTQVRDDLVRRDAILMRFPEVESVVGKAGRADTATDPSPIDMVESIINLKPRPQWPKRKVIFNDAAAEAAQLFDSMRLRGRFASTLTDLQRKDIINESAMNAVARFDAFARVLCLERFAAMPAVPDSDADAAEPWYSQIINPAIQLFDTEPESPALARAARFGRAREAAAVEFINGINRELIQRGSYQLLSFLAEELLLGAQRRAALTAGPDDTATEARAAALERTPEFTKTFFLWQKQKGDLLQELDTEVRMPGWGNIWTQPIINRVDMLATGVRSMVGVKVFGDDRASTVSTIQKIQDLSNAIAQSLKTVPGAVDVVADQSVGEMYLDINFDRARAARYGVTMADVGELIEVAVGGKPVTETVEGRRRFPVRVRYGRDFVEDAAAIRNILLSAKGGDSQMVMIPLSEVADVRLVEGPTMIKSEDGKLRAYVQLNVRDRDIVSFVDEAQRAVAAAVAMPAGFHIEWSGQFEHQVHARKTLQLVFPAAILLIFVILYITYKDLAATGIMALAVPGAIAGAAICQWLWGCNFSVAVWVGYIACFGMATGTAIVMLVYLREAIDNRGGLAKIQSESELATALMEGAVHRLRPKLLTEATTILGLVPMLWATGTGAEVMRPMAVPILGGILVADEVIDLLVPVLYYSLMRYRWRKLHNQ
ncbi:MAG: efflux RND transporter permease subunit [Planctomycetes bacterium]|nr:efflux RND transporter permease subunit [Planctomycetota bacterium]